MTLRARVDRHRCIGAGTCITIAPTAFDWYKGDFAKAGVVDAASVEDEVLREAALACPTGAITIEEVEELLPWQLRGKDAPRRVEKTFMFTDIESSTNLVEALGDEVWQGVLRWHNETLRSLFAEHKGEEVVSTGDGFFVGVRLSRRGARVRRRDPAPAGRAPALGGLRAEGADRPARVGRDAGRAGLLGQGRARGRADRGARGRRPDRREPGHGRGRALLDLGAADRDVARHVRTDRDRDGRLELVRSGRLPPRLAGMRVCPSCGAENPDEARFCMACASPLAEPARSREVRKSVTVVFCDVTGSTALGELLDPEALRRVMTRYFDTMKIAIEHHGGTVEKFIGDAVMAVFGIPHVHEDDAVRAARAAIEMREGLLDLNKQLERDHGVTLAVEDRCEHRRGRRGRSSDRASARDRRCRERRGAARAGGRSGRDLDR